MKNLRKLIKGIIVEIIIFVAALLLFLLICLFFRKPSSAEALVMRILIYLLFASMATLAMGIYLVAVFGVYRSAKVKLMKIPGFSEVRFEREIMRMPQYDRMFLCSDAICYADSGYLIKVIPLADILWVYQEDQRNVVQIYTRSKEKYEIRVFMKGKGAGKKRSRESDI